MVVSTLTFAGVTIRYFQEEKWGYTIIQSATTLQSGDIAVKLSTKKINFPRSFECYVLSLTEREAIEALIGTFGTLVLDGVSYTNCYFSNFTNIHLEYEDTDIWTFTLELSQADVIL